MNILVVQGHPDPESFTRNNAMHYYRYAKSKGHTVNLLDLSKNNFDPVLRYGYRKHMKDEEYIKNVQRLIKESDHISFFFPIWWAAEPSILKGLVDRTLTPHFSYIYMKSGAHKQLLNGKTADIFSSSHGPQILYKIYGNVFSRWKHLILGYCGIKLKHCYDLGKMDSRIDSLKRRNSYINKCSHTLDNIR
ncbi:NAD(P)H-dependent oxidoreductase [Apilactobacillus kunkeei]|uniref:NAD(P)H-dependent oxidoreductase n=1 Tax=Apilactobacillus kunkeei TaxID=148814 RepID=UPI0030E9B29F